MYSAEFIEFRVSGLGAGSLVRTLYSMKLCTPRAVCKELVLCALKKTTI